MAGDVRHAVEQEDLLSSGWIDLAPYVRTDSPSRRSGFTSIQVVNLHFLLSQTRVTARPSVLWCYKKDLGFTRCDTTAPLLPSPRSLPTAPQHTRPRSAPSVPLHVRGVTYSSIVSVCVCANLGCLSTVTERSARPRSSVTSSEASERQMSRVRSSSLWPLPTFDTRELVFLQTCPG